MVDTLALGASAVRREGSSPFIRTIVKTRPMSGFNFGHADGLKTLNPGAEMKIASGDLQGNVTNELCSFD